MWNIRKFRNVTTRRFRTVTRFGRNGALLFFPIAILFAYQILGEPGLIISAALSTVGLIVFQVSSGRPSKEFERDALTGLYSHAKLLEDAQVYINTCQREGRATAGLAIEIDDFDDLTGRVGPGNAGEILAQTAARLQAVLRGSDLIAKAGKAKFSLILSPVGQLDLESVIRLSTRLHQAIEEPIRLNGTNTYVSACTGFCLLVRSPAETAVALIESAEKSLRAAQQASPGSIRAFSHEVQRVTLPRQELRSDIETALSNGEIHAWFQPQVSTDSGKITGVEALARWVHPKRGVLSPSGFLPEIQKSGLLARLGEVILYNALNTLKKLDKIGTNIPVVAVNFSSAELLDPRLVDRIRWELDRFDLSPSRLGIEVLETVFAAHNDDVICRNIRDLAKMGCPVDLDDFGTGHASISSIRQFAIGRLKIDRSFVTHVDSDQAQQRMISAILTMAEQLQLETLAEGVETPGEHAMLAQLGCGYVQGFGVAKPMPAEDLPAWCAAYEGRLDAALGIGRKIK